MCYAVVCPHYKAVTRLDFLRTPISLTRIDVALGCPYDRAEACRLFQHRMHRIRVAFSTLGTRRRAMRALATPLDVDYTNHHLVT